jgi:hypothetical protein
MPAKLSTLENALLFRFDGEDRLYTDHLGRRVIVDVEGFGIMRLLASDPPVLSVRCEAEPQEFCPEFENGSIVLATCSGEVSVQVLKGRSEPVDGQPFQASGSHDGCGWVVQASTVFTVDDRHELAPMPAEGLPIPFFRNVRGNGNWSIVPASSVFCEPADSFSIDDENGLKQRGFKVQNITAVSFLESEFSDGTRLGAPVASHLNLATFAVSVPEDNQGLILRKTYDRFHGRQRARVFVDGVFAGWWYEAGEDRKRRWHSTDFGIDAKLTAGKSQVQITIDPPAGVALWSMSRYEVFAMRPR